MPRLISAFALTRKMMMGHSLSAIILGEYTVSIFSRYVRRSIQMADTMEVRTKLGQILRENVRAEKLNARLFLRRQ